MTRLTDEDLADAIDMAERGLIETPLLRLRTGLGDDMSRALLNVLYELRERRTADSAMPVDLAAILDEAMVSLDAASKERVEHLVAEVRRWRKASPHLVRLSDEEKEALRWFRSGLASGHNATIRSMLVVESQLPEPLYATFVAALDRILGEKP